MLKTEASADGEVGVTTWTSPVRGERAVRWAAQQGLRAVHLDEHDLTGGVEALVTAARSCDVRLAGFAVSGLEAVGLSDLARARRTIDVALEQADALSISFVYLPSFGRAVIRTAADLRGTAALLRHALAGSPPTTIVASESSLGADGTLRLFHAVDDERLRLLLDTQNPALHGHSAARLVRALPDRLAPFVHVKDGVASKGDAVVGTGSADVGDTIAALVQAGYTGSFVLEGDYRAAAPERVRADVRELGRLLARHASATAA
jgi:sugar phosphate isomerase/epimerase